MELMTVTGFFIGFISICLAYVLEGSSLSTLVNIPALIIVFGGSFAAVLIQTPQAVFRRAITISRWALSPPEADFIHLIERVCLWSKKTRQYGLLSIENNIYGLKDPFIKKGAELLVSGISVETLNDVLEYEIDTIESRDINAAKVFESMGGYTPTLGILGAVLGLIHVMQTLTEPDQLGAGIAIAFVATVYGVGFANLFFIPLANRLKLYVYHRTRLYEMYLVGLVALANKESTHVIEVKMKSFIHEKN